MSPVADHAHCEICSRTVALGERFCDRAECLEKHEQNVKEKKRQVWMFIGVIVAAVVLSRLLASF